MGSFILDDALIFWKLPRSDPILENLIQFLQRSALHLRQEEDEEQDTEEVRPEPDITVFWTLGSC